MQKRNMKSRNKLQKISYLWISGLGIWCLLFCSCVYFNTFYNAQYYFRQGKKMVTNDTLVTDSEHFDKTIEKSTSVIVKYPQSRYVDDALFMMGVSYYYKGDYPRALEKLDYLLYNYSESKYYDDALYFRGLAFFKQQKYGEAVVDLTQAKQFNKYRTRAMLILCYAYYATENYAKLTDIAGQMIQERLSKEEHRWILSILGDAQFQQEYFQEALTTYDQLLSITRTVENKRAVKLRIAETYLEMGEYEKCRDFLEGEYDPEFRIIFADLNAELGDTVKARDVYLEVGVSAFSEIAAEAFYKIAELYRGQDSLDMAVAFYDSAMSRSMTGDYGSQAKKMADVLRRIKVLSEQTEDLDEAQFMLAETYYVDFNEPDRASHEYEAVYTRYPESAWAPKALYARFWINHKIIQNDSIAYRCAVLLTRKYPDTEYAVNAAAIVGLDQVDEEDNGEPENNDENNAP